MKTCMLNRQKLWNLEALNTVAFDSVRSFVPTMQPEQGHLYEDSITGINGRPPC